MSELVNSPETPSEEHLDASVLVDNPPASKTRWIVAAAAIVLVVFGLQFGARTITQWLAKPHSGNAQAITTLTKTPSSYVLPTPQAQEKNLPKSTPDPQLDVTAYLKSKEVKAGELTPLQQAQLYSRLSERKKSLELEEAMRQSPVLLSIGVGTQNAGPDSAIGLREAGVDVNPNTAYLNSVSNQALTDVKAQRLGDLRYLLAKGKVLQGVTESAIDSDLPNIIRAHVTADIYAEQGDLVLVPNGSQLIGEYRSGDLKNGQTTLFVVWTRLRRPDGIVVNLDSAGSDPLGRAGMSGPVDHHYMQRFGAAIAFSMMNFGVSNLGVNGGDRYNSQAAYRQSVGSAFAQTAGGELQQNTQIQNSIRPPQGSRISILINHDISFENVLSEGE